ncbi:MAG TPA: flagellar assembly protein FliX [Alphaproteobacteria bacterium]|nr:flagellar assembly protein FliX [Alphaproteobacteria bacterium]
MKIDPTGSARGAGSVRRTDRAGATRSGDFARHLDSPGASAGVNGSNPVSTVNALLSLQEVDDSLSGRARARQRAADILDQLDALRDGLLAGVLPREAIVRLAHLVRSHRPEVTDQRLKDVLDEIELRAEVELAKLDSRTGDR